jgi:hypothetical protein
MGYATIGPAYPVGYATIGGGEPTEVLPLVPVYVRRDGRSAGAPVVVAAGVVAGLVALGLQ